MPLRPEELLHPRPEGLYCPMGDFYIDPMRAVARALITHGHSDHARAGHGAVLATRETLAIMALRMGEEFCGERQAVAYGAVIHHYGVDVSFHPAGHVLGSAQILLDYKGLRIAVSGDYKRADDPTTAPFTPVPCHVFITEATFGLPVFHHPDAAGEVGKLLASLIRQPGRAHLIGAYSLGKAQRVMRLIRQAGYDAPIYLHGAMEKVTRFYESEGIDLGSLLPVPPAKSGADLAGAIILAPPSAMHDRWSQRFGDCVHVAASGWMRIKARARQSGVELPLIISDHADWRELQQTIRETGASQIWVTHGQEDALVHWCGTQGLAAKPLRLIGYGDEEVEEAA